MPLLKMSGMDPWEVIEQALPRLKPRRNREWLALQLGIKPQALGNWKERGVPKGRFFELADLLRLTPDQVAGRAPVPWESEIGWPFPGIDERRYESLGDAQKDQIQAAVFMMIEKFEQARPQASGKY